MRPPMPGAPPRLYASAVQRRVYMYLCEGAGDAGYRYVGSPPWNTGVQAARIMFMRRVPTPAPLAWAGFEEQDWYRVSVSAKGNVLKTRRHAERPGNPDTEAFFRFLDELCNTVPPKVRGTVPVP